MNKIKDKMQMGKFMQTPRRGNLVIIGSDNMGIIIGSRHKPKKTGASPEKSDAEDSFIVSTKTNIMNGIL